MNREDTLRDLSCKRRTRTTQHQRLSCVYRSKSNGTVYLINYILFRNKNMELNGKNYKLLINGEDIVLVSKTKFLGIIVDEHLEWNEHINLCKRKISSGNYVLKSLKNTLSTSLLTTIYYSMIHPYLSYGIMLWGSTCKRHLHKIEILQKKAIRSLYKTRYNEHTMPLFHSSKILKINDLYKFQLLMFMYNYYQNNLPSPLCSLFTRNCEIHGHYTRRRNDPRVVSHSTHLIGFYCCVVCIVAYKFLFNIII